MKNPAQQSEIFLSNQPLADSSIANIILQGAKPSNVKANGKPEETLPVKGKAKGGKRAVKGSLATDNVVA